MRRSWLFAICAAGLLAPGSAEAGGGPVGPVQGGAGVTSPAAGGTVNYVAVSAGGKTLIERIHAVEHRLLPEVVRELCVH